MTTNASLAGQDWSLPFASARQPVLARNVVATSQPLAAQAGAAAFARGGNAIDAALAAAITLTVVEPVMNGIGGDGFALVWDGERLHGLNASGRAPAGWSPQRFADRAAMPYRGWDSVTVPGQVAGWVALSERFGALPFGDLFADAIRHARDGFPVSPVIAGQWAQSVQELHGHPGFGAFMPHGRAPAAGEVWRFADQAATLEEIARTRGGSFYRGRLAEAIAGFAAEHGAALTAGDLAAHRAEWVEPISVDFRGRRVHEIPPNGQGLAALIALGLIEHLPYDETAPGSAARMHLEIEAMRAAFADLHAHVADPDHMRVTAAQLLDAAYLRERARAIDPRRAGSYPAGRPASGGTVYLCTADAQGRMVSYIQSNFKGFGSGVVVPGTGIALHNRGSGFVTTPGHPNEVGGGKRPLHSIIPAFLSRDGRPEMAFGVMGGNMQAQGHVQMVLRRAVEGRSPQACADAPRWRINDAAVLTVEPAVPPAVVEGLRALGYAPAVAAPGNLDFGSAQLALRLPGEEVVYAAGSDPRRDGQAVGY
ncbi:gamma-glutamyltransferase family protein [Xylophilus sp.]|uniref:gamma-glutamyltransferase family protein n=1 Tax=Xylophilus sp. TaxID=2653893 RepID=UPI0013BBB2AB|nr:gamma-glutamyltransferase family protein [Xylophilus sp.]KAF1046285.1 MAG: Glutathione hydrolase-like YwrD proenzyme [Xylophilus sp.]